MNPFNRNTIHHLVQCLILMFGVSGPVVASEPTAVQWSTVRHVWGEDLSGSLQGAGGIGGLLRTTQAAVLSDGKRNTEHEQTPTEHTFHYDSNGNIILLTDAQANESARYAYDAFGKTLTAATGPAARANRYRFSTKPVEEESGLVYYGYRYYDPLTGRWPSRDPIGELGGLNLYLMVKNRFPNKVDYLGACEVANCENPCRDAKLQNMHVQPDGNLAAGGVVCCGGKKYSCNWDPSRQKQENDKGSEIVANCVDKHEDTHHGQVTCNGNGLHRPHFDDPSKTNENECAAYTAQLDCLTNARDTCDDQLCRNRVDSEINNVNLNKLFYCQ